MTPVAWRRQRTGLSSLRRRRRAPRDHRAWPPVCPWSRGCPWLPSPLSRLALLGLLGLLALLGRPSRFWRPSWPRASARRAPATPHRPAGGSSKLDRARAPTAWLALAEEGDVVDPEVVFAARGILGFEMDREQPLGIDV